MPPDTTDLTEALQTVEAYVDEVRQLAIDLQGGLNGVTHALQQLTVTLHSLRHELTLPPPSPHDPRLGLDPDTGQPVTMATYLTLRLSAETCDSLIARVRAAGLKYWGQPKADLVASLVHATLTPHLPHETPHVMQEASLTSLPGTSSTTMGPPQKRAPMGPPEHKPAKRQPTMAECLEHIADAATGHITNAATGHTTNAAFPSPTRTYPRK